MELLSNLEIVNLGDFGMLLKTANISLLGAKLQKVVQAISSSLPS
jgi:hypothetical protein